MKVPRMREQRPSLEEFSSWCLPPVLDSEQQSQLIKVPAITDLFLYPNRAAGEAGGAAAGVGEAFINFSDVSNIDQRLRNSGCMLVPSPHRIGSVGDRECCMLPPVNQES